MNTIPSEFFDPKEEDVLLKLTMPKRELRLATVEKMKTIKQQELQQKQTQLNQQVQQPISPQPVQPHPQLVQQPVPVVFQPSVAQPIIMPEPQVIPEQLPIQEVQPIRVEQPVIQETPWKEPEIQQPIIQQPVQQKIEYHQGPQPTRDVPVAASPFSNVDMFRIESLTRGIMYRDYQKPGAKK